MKKHWKAAVLVGLGVAVVIQLVPVERSNPPVVSDVAADAEVDALLRRACYDCHSNETAWPWYGYVAPVSWLLAHHIDEGREHLNFSDWPRYADDADEIAEEVHDGDMPLWAYTLMDSKRRLSAAERDSLVRWAKAQATGAPEAGAHHRDTDDDEDSDSDEH